MATIIQPDYEIIDKTEVSTQYDVEEKGVVIVHCIFKGEGAIRIWRSTFLVDSQSNHRSKLIHAENISLAPRWTLVNSESGYTFTLYFEGLPKSCKKFDLCEIIPQPGGFYIPAIVRNMEDVYEVDLF